MTIEEAIEHIQDVICENNPPNITIFKLEKEALYMAIEALEKQVIKEPKFLLRASRFICPVCGYNVEHKYCPECGQKLDWEEEEE